MLEIAGTAEDGFLLLEAGRLCSVAITLLANIIFHLKHDKHFAPTLLTPDQLISGISAFRKDLDFVEEYTPLAMMIIQ